MQPNLKFIDYPVYIHQITQDIHEFHIESETEEENNEEEGYAWCVMSIDIGVHHLGVSVSLLDEEYKLIEIIWIDLINITEYDRCPNQKDCRLHHTKTFCDWLNHTFQENIGFYDMADFILVERQPPMGFVVIEQLIFSKWREKSILISPNSMHKYFGIGKYDYEKRKEYTDKIARMKITDVHLLEQLGFYHRTHDIADSICIMLYWINKKQEEYSQEQRRKRITERQMYIAKHGKKLSTEEWFEMHRYIPR